MKMLMVMEGLMKMVMEGLMKMLMLMVMLMEGLMKMVSSKRIQLARGWCATVPQSGGTVRGNTVYPPTPPLRRPGLPVFWGSQPCVPAAWLAERLLLAGDIESNPGPRPTLKTPTHTHPTTHTHQVH